MLCAGEASWPQFRGPQGSGVAASSTFPIVFGPDTNLAWKVPMVSGHSSPCIHGDRLLLTGRVEDRLQILCLDRKSGKSLWTREVEPDRMEKGTSLSNPAASTACTDGKRFYVYFGSFGVLAFDLEGKELWRKALPAPLTQHGTGTSPVCADGRVYLVCDQDVDSYLLALDAETGAVSWKTPRPDARRSFSSPLLYPEGKPSHIVVAGTLRLTAYDLRTGVEAWGVSGLPNEMVASPIARGEVVFVAGWTSGSGVPRMPTYDSLLAQGDGDQDGRLSQAEAPAGPARHHFPYIDANKDGFIERKEWESMAAIFEKSENALMAVQPGGAGPKVLWKQSRGLPYVPSPLWHEGRLWVVKNGGLVSCYDAASGKVHFQEERLDAMGDYYASPVAAGDRVCMVSQPGMAVVLKSGDTLEVLARNRLGEPVMATPAIVDGYLYVRTQNQMMAFREASIP